MSNSNILYRCVVFLVFNLILSWVTYGLLPQIFTNVERDFQSFSLRKDLSVIILFSYFCGCIVHFITRRKIALPDEFSLYTGTKIYFGMNVVVFIIILMFSILTRI